jgi:hypothetical protein
MCGRFFVALHVNDWLQGEGALQIGLLLCQQEVSDPEQYPLF